MPECGSVTLEYIKSISEVVVDKAQAYVVDGAVLFGLRMSGLLVFSNGLVHVTRNIKAQDLVYNIIEVQIGIHPRREEAKHIEPSESKNNFFSFQLNF